MGINSSRIDDKLIDGAGNAEFEARPYFITICTYGRQMTLGGLRGGQVELNTTGLLVEEEWLQTGENNAALKLDTYCIMPNHFHAIFWIVGHPNLRNKDLSQPKEAADPVLPDEATSIGEIIERFKVAVTDRVNAAQDTHESSFWQPSYHCHVIGSDKAIPAMRRYVNDNPVNWSRDLMNPLVADPSCLIPDTGTRSK